MLALKNLRTTDYSAYTSTLGQAVAHNSFVTVSGYESRCTDWARRVLDLNSDHRERFTVFGFQEFEDDEERKMNDAFYESRGINITVTSSGDCASFLSFIQKEVEVLQDRSGEDPIHIHLDYSSMPRSWYCNVVVTLDEVLRARDTASMWYSPGKYQSGEYPPGRISDFKIFSGAPSLIPVSRTHIFGLGFDSVRAQGAWSVLDPQNLVCFYADPAIVAGYAEQAVSDNSELLSIAQYVFTVPLGDFVYTYSRIREIVLEYYGFGDVILVPDGPKPLILAASLTPLSIGRPGVVSLHISRPKGNRTSVVAVEAVDVEPVGFCFSGHKT